MTAPVEFELTAEQLEGLLDACKPVPYIVIGGVEPRSPQEKANAVWQQLGRELGFDWTTVQPVPGKEPRFFTALVVPA